MTSTAWVDVPVAWRNAATKAAIQDQFPDVPARMIAAIVIAVWDVATGKATPDRA